MDRMESLAQHIMYWVGQINALQKGMRRKNRKIARLKTELAECKEDFNTCYKELEGERKRADELQAEVDGSHDSIIRQDDILTGVANALKGQPDDLMAHSHHDLAEVAQRVVVERDALIESLRELLNDCINFDGGKLSDCKLKQASDTLANIDKEESK